MQTGTTSPVEIVARRDAFTKHFLTAPGRFRAVTHDHPIHYFEEGVWKDIDNTLVETVDVFGQQGFRNRANSLHLSFSGKSDSDISVQMEYNGCKLQWDHEGVDVPTVTVEGAAIRYCCQNGLTVQCEAREDGVKETYIVKDADALDALALRLYGDFDIAATKENAVTVADSRTGERRFIIEPPEVWDADGKPLRPDVHLENCITYSRMSFVFSKDELARAAWPVTIDPLVRLEQRDGGLENTYIRSDYTTSYYGGSTRLVTGVYNTAESVSLFRLKTPMQRKASDTILSAKLMLTGSGSSYFSDNCVLGAYRITKDWDSSNVTWSSFQPHASGSIDTKLLSFNTSNRNVQTWDITDAYLSWYVKDEEGNVDNNGIALKRPPDITYRSYAEWYSSRSSTTSCRPCIVVDYLSHAGLEDWWQYETMTAGRAGTAHVDLLNGNLVVSHPDLATGGLKLPFAVTHYYNSCLSRNIAPHCGSGWRTSAHQTLRKDTIDGTDYYTWTDGDGTDHWFKATGSQPWEDAEGMKLRLSIDTSASTATITDKSHSQMVFPLPTGSGKKYITKIIDAKGNGETNSSEHNCQMTFTWDANAAGKLLKATDGAGRETLFEYNANDLLSKITAPDGRFVRYWYDGYRLITVKYSDQADTPAKCTTYTYLSGSYLMTSMRNHDGTKITIGYEDPATLESYANVGDHYDELARRVTRIELTNGDAKGAKKLFEYLPSATKVTEVRSNTEDTGKALTYQFNESGNVICVSDELGNAQCAKFESGIPNAVSDASRMQKAVINLLKNMDFSANWTQASGTGSRDTGVRCLGMPSWQTTGSAAINQLIPVTRSGPYTFSVYVKTTGLTGTGACCKLSVNGVTTASTLITESTADASNGPGAEGWERVFVTADVPNGTTQIKVILSCISTEGSVRFAAPQLEAGGVPNRVNLLLNGDFARTVVNTENPDSDRLFPADWTKGAGITTAIENCVRPNGHGMPDCLMGNALRMQSGKTASDVAFHQVVDVSGGEGDVFAAGGWCKSNSVLSGAPTSAPAICYRLYHNGWQDWHRLEFSMKQIGWHFMCWPIVADCDFTKAELAVMYEKNARTAMFSNLFLHREQFGETYTYDANKNVTSVANLVQQKSKATYDSYDNTLTYLRSGAADADSYKYKFTYGDSTAAKKRHLVRTETTPEGVRQSYTYDAYGNRLTAKNQPSSAGTCIQTETTYQNAGNDVLAQTDARGKAVTYTVNADSSLVTQVTDPTGQSIQYTYDSANRVTKAEAAVGSDTYTNEYAYANDRLASVSHNTASNACDVTYSFAYDPLGRKTQVSVGSQPLSTNTYSDDRWGLLTQVDYGNGGKVRYGYDDYGRLASVGYDDGPADRYTYQYGANGQVAIVTDSFLGRTHQTEYDLAERPVQHTQRSASGTLQYRSTVRYDGQNRPDLLTERVGDTTYKTHYAYDRDSRVTDITMAGTRGVSYTYDALGRLATRTATNGTDYLTTYTYAAHPTDANRTTPLVKTISQGSGDNQFKYSYTYESRGNILTETRNDGATVTYAYDALGQLIQVDDPTDPSGGSSGTRWVYDYDLGGNITDKRYYARGTDTLMGHTAYSYDTTWKDKLVQYGTKELSYDAIGNPLNDGTWAYTWRAGRQLGKMVRSSDGTALTYRYDHNGLRTHKIVTEGDTVTTWLYTLNGKRVAHLKVTTAVNGVTTETKDLHFYYDAQGRPGIVRVGTSSVYTYVYDLQGDVVGLLDATGAKVVEYHYDAWGRKLYTTGSLAETLGKLNPFRYRGYVYDEETGFYYLRSRYYNPRWGRFVNADTWIGASTSPLDHNIFTYCCNNPVIRSDESGHLWGVSLLVIALAAVAVSVSGCSKNSTISKSRINVGAAKPFNSVKGSNNPNSPNCYAYAIGSPVNEQPGKRSGRFPTEWNNVVDVGLSVEADLTSMGRSIRVINSFEDEITSEEYRIALRVGTKPFYTDPTSGIEYFDYHFMKQTSTGSWAEKHGIGGDSLEWPVGMTPDTIPWQFGGKEYYDSPIIYYAIGG